MKTVAYVQRVAEIDQNSQQLVWLGRKPQPFEESDIVLSPGDDGEIVDLESAQEIISQQKYMDGIEIVEIVFVD